MRLNAIVLVCAVVAGLAEPALAADITQQGADNLKRDLTRLLPKDAQKNGSINVNPVGERYEIIYDLDKDTLKTSSNGWDEPRPSAFGGKGRGRAVEFFQRKKR